MKKCLLALLTALLLILPLAAPAEGSVILPDLALFAGDRLGESVVEDFGFCQRVTLYGTKENVQLAAESYIDLLVERFSIRKDVHFTNYYDGGQYRRHYALSYIDPTVVSGGISYEDENEGWHIADAAVVLSYSQYDTDNFVQLTYCSAFICVDTGDRLPAATLQTLPDVAPTPRSGTTTTTTIRNITTASTNLCKVCNGQGSYNAICLTCDGEGVAYQPCTFCYGNGKRSCEACAAQGSYSCFTCSGSGTRSCSTCGGTGHHSSSSHHGSSHHSSSDKCSTCGGDGKRSCSTCGGLGQRTCNTCSGAGLRQCLNCGGTGDGTQRTRCATCNGTGHHQLHCDACDGAGVVN